MPSHPALTQGNLAVILGGASGIGLAAATLYRQRGLKVVIGDVDQTSLDSALSDLQRAGGDKDGVAAFHVDVSRRDSVEQFQREVRSRFPDADVSVLMANAGVGGPTKASSSEGWDRILGVNFYGVVNVCQTFLPDIKKHGKPALIINTGSKQGITTPPGTGPAYNVSKAGVKVFTEQLAHELREDSEGKNIDVKLLIPGWVHTGLTGAKSGKPKPDGAWTPQQTVEFMLERIDAGSFYILCPDNETKRELDLARMEWNINDVIQDRPPLSRWHDEYKGKYDEFVKSKGL